MKRIALACAECGSSDMQSQPGRYDLSRCLRNGGAERRISAYSLAERKQKERRMNLGIIAIVVSILCLGASFFGAPAAVNIVGLVAGIVGLILLGRARKSIGKSGDS
jgi:hypothetical protein